MNRLRIMLTMAVLALATAPASAQVTSFNGTSPTQYMRPPALSPYLNLALGRDPAVNYFLGVRGAMDRRLNDRIVGSAIQDLDRRTQPEGDGELFPTLTGTGHPAGFVNYGSYFNFSRPGQRPAQTLPPPRR